MFLVGCSEEIETLSREIEEIEKRLRWAYGGYGGLLLWTTVVIIGFGIGFWEMLKNAGSYALGFEIGLGVGLTVAVAVGLIVYFAVRKP